MEAEVGSILQNHNGFTWVLIRLTKKYATFICISTGNSKNPWHTEGFMHSVENKKGNIDKYNISNSYFTVTGKVKNIENLLILYGKNK